MRPTGWSSGYSGQAEGGKKLAMADGTGVIRALSSIKTPLSRGAALVKKPMNAQAFRHNRRQALHGRLWGHRDLGSSSCSFTPDSMVLGMNLSDPGLPHL